MTTVAERGEELASGTTNTGQNGPGRTSEGSPNPGDALELPLAASLKNWESFELGLAFLPDGGPGQDGF